MDKIPTWEEMEASGKWDDYGSMAREYARRQKNAALEAVLNKAEYSSINPMKKIIDKKSILNAYPDKLII